ncbi:hypothetical protein TSMEX_007900 [Taenia solium]|eukprot:TsM_001120200 transcript=TsM_001120200 gene=TsM_001120200
MSTAYATGVKGKRNEVFVSSLPDEIVAPLDDQEESEIVEQPWFHGPLNPKIAFSRLLNSGSFLMTSDEHDRSLFHLYMKWNGRCFSIDIPFNPVTKNYSLGPVERNSVVDLINFYITNQLPVCEDIGAILFSPVVVPQSGSMDESEICTPPVDGAGHKEYGAFSGLNSGRRGLGLSQYASTPPTGLKLDRKRIRYLPMSGKPSHYRNVSLNKSLGNLTSIYCDPSNFSGSTLSLPTTSFTDLTHKDTTSQRLTKMCQGFVNYNLTLPFLTFDDVSKPLDESAFISVGKVLLNAKADTVATCLAIETASILTLNWLPTPGDDISLPSDGYSLLLWPAANGYRRDLFNRDRFLSLFLTASIVIQKEVGLKAALLSLWMNVIEKLIVCHRDYFTANALANGICVDQILNQRSLWEQAFACEENPEAVDKLKSLLLERRVQEASPIETTASCLAQIDVCVPNIAPLVEDLYRVQPPDVDSGGLPPASLLQKLSVAKGAYSRQRKNGVNYIDLWVKKRWFILRMNQIPRDLQAILKTENLLLLLMGPVDISHNDDLEDCFRRLSGCLSLLPDS